MRRVIQQPQQAAPRLTVPSLSFLHTEQAWQSPSVGWLLCFGR